MESHPKLKPVDAPTRGVYFAGFCESPKDIKDSVCQAGAASSRAGALLNAGEIKIEAITSVIDAEACTKCGICASVCPYGAITWQKKEIATVVEAACAGCGTCGAACTFGAITMRHFTDEQLMAQVRAVLAEKPEDKVFVFACNWCSYAGGDMAGISRIQYPSTNRVIRTMCSARVSEEMVLEAFRCGAPGGAGLGLPLRRLPLHRRQPADRQAGAEAVEQAREGRGPARAAAARVDQRRRGPEVRQGHEADGGAARDGDPGGDRAREGGAQAEEEESAPAKKEPAAAKEATA